MDRRPSVSKHRLLAIPSREPAGAGAEIHARRERVPLAARHPLAVEGPRGEPVRRSTPTAQEFSVQYVPGESDTDTVRRQLQLARADLVPRQLPPRSRRWSATTTSTATRSRSSARPAPGSMMNLKEVARELGRAGCRHLPPRLAAAGARATATTRATPPTRTGATWSCSTNTSTATRARVWAPATRRAGPRWSRAAWRSLAPQKRTEPARAHGQEPRAVVAAAKRVTFGVPVRMAVRRDSRETGSPGNPPTLQLSEYAAAVRISNVLPWGEAACEPCYPADRTRFSCACPLPRRRHRPQGRHAARRHGQEDRRRMARHCAPTARSPRSPPRNVKSIELGSRKATSSGRGSSAAPEMLKPVGLRRSVEALTTQPDHRALRALHRQHEGQDRPRRSTARTWRLAGAPRPGLRQAGHELGHAGGGRAAARQEPVDGRRGREQLRAGRVAEAESLLQQALNEDPTNPAALYLRGVMLYRADKLVDARKAFEAVNKAVEKHAPTLNNLAVIVCAAEPARAGA